MKRISSILMFFLILTAIVVHAQDPTPQQVQSFDQLHYMLKDGVMYQIRDGEQVQFKESLKLQNGTVINQDGSYLLQNGKQFRLRDGECLDVAGNRFATQQQFFRHTRRQAQVNNGEYFMMQRGRLYRMKNQEMQPVDSKIQCRNGTTLNPDGTYQLKNQNRQQLRDGQCMDPDGNLYQSQQRYRDKMMRRMNDPSLNRNNPPAQRQQGQGRRRN